MKGIKTRRLYTRQGRALTGIPWNAYPRPQMRREKWLSLNGEWAFSAESGSGGITVPFCPESLLSGFAGPIRYGETLTYQRAFTLPEDWRGMRILLHFGAVSRECRVFVNERPVCSHQNAYLPFEADITDLLLPGENTLTVTAVNDLSPRYPYGKQKIKRGGMWYTPVSGIWQTVWLEPVPKQYIRRLVIRAEGEEALIRAEGVTEGTLLCDGKAYPLTNGEARIRPENPRLWSPEHPELYDFTLQSGEDRVASYFALRTLSVEKAEGIPRLCLNGVPYFFHGLLDQGYWSDGLYTPSSPECYREDIAAAKGLGFNTLRKHVKIEPEQFYYDCDRLGMAVFQDMVNNGFYRFFRDTALPTLGFKNADDRRRGDPETREEYLKAAEETVELLSNHPCICCWTLFNEGWGQFDSAAVYRRMKELDGTRFIDTASGWFTPKESDVASIHSYFKKLRPGRRGDLPQILSEFGGYVWKDPAHSFNLNKTYGYKKYDKREDLAAALLRVYRQEVLPLAEQGLCAAVYTQLSDVEDETNGLLTFDRQVRKVIPEELAEIGPALQKAVKGKRG